MKTLAILLFALSLPGSHFAAPPHSPATHADTQQARKGGQWYLARNGHAVYCYGPVKVMNHGAGGLQRVATYCQGGQVMVPLKD